MEEDTLRPGWTIPRNLIARIELAWHLAKVAGSTMNKSEFVCEMIRVGLSNTQIVKSEPGRAHDAQAR